MLDKQFLDSLSNKIARLIPRSSEMGEDARAALRGLLQKSFSELNILTRDEFDSRARSLERAEQRVAELEQEIAALELRLNDALSEKTP
ncbi:MAG: accessory factor UbiK family protein [Gammaproteobacteria bacterium]|nr:accessory factor UbiK family protein [Gammaproteobacteria bacterium]